MNTRLLLAAIVAMVAMFLGGWLIWGIILKSESEGMSMGMIALGHVFIGALIAWLANSMGTTTLMKGLLNGFIIGLLWGLAMIFIDGKEADDAMKVITGGIANGAWCAIGMGAAALVLGMKKSEA
ncbi:MAG: hypothetical protein KG003_08915 [Bacteroidetes bacterium]|nr:hypothetical protein [Bacteroidota bacterium]